MAFFAFDDHVARIGIRLNHAGRKLHAYFDLLVSDWDSSPWVACAGDYGDRYSLTPDGDVALAKLCDLLCSIAIEGKLTNPTGNGIPFHLGGCIVKTQLERPLSIEEALGRIKRGLVDRSKKDWTVTLNRGASFGWIHVISPIQARNDDMLMTGTDRVELSNLLALQGVVRDEGLLFPARDASYASM